MDDPVVEAVEAALQLQPDTIELRAHLLDLYRERGRIVDARRQLGEILSRDPEHVAVDALLADAWRLRVTLGASDVGANLPGSTLPTPPAVPHSPEHATAGDDPTGQRRPQSEPPAEEGASTPIMERAGSGGDPAEWEDPDTTLDDVAGMEHVKERLELVVFGPARRPDLAEAFGRAGRGGLLLWGPPGCGKTFLARAVAGHLGVSFGSVGIEAVLDQWLGGSERNLAALFARARATPPCVLFLDEVDAIGQRRSRLRSEHLRTVMSQLLVELDGVDRDNRGLFVIAASNLPWDVDPALRRPGRLDRSVFVPPPDAEARARILVDRVYKVPLATIDVTSVVSLTAGYSGADVAHVADTAAELALAESIKGDEIVPVGQDHLERAVAQVQPSISDWVATARNAATWADDESLFGPFLEWLEQWDRRR